MRDYEINVKGLCTYTIREAESEEEAIIQKSEEVVLLEEIRDLLKKQSK